MKLLFLNSSLRRGGSTEGLIDYAIHYLNRYPFVQSSVVHLCERNIQVCDSCYDCEKGICWMQDDVPGIVEQMLDADGIIYAVPVHAFGTNSLMQVFLERAGVGYLRFERPLEGKIASILVSGRRYAHEMVWSQIALNIMLNKMILVGSGFPAVIKNDGKQLGRQIVDDEGLLAVRETLNKMVDTCFCLQHSSQTSDFISSYAETGSYGYSLF